MTTLESAGADQDLWHVEVAPNDVRVVTLDQLDHAFQNGLVNESTRVWQDGMPCATSLGELLGGDDMAVSSESVQYEQAAQYQQPQYQAPVEYRHQPPAQYQQPEYQYQAQVRYQEPVQYVPPRSAPPPSRAAESAWPPVVARSETPPPVSSRPPAMSTPAPPSMAPMALDVPDFDDVQYARSGGKGKFLLAAIVVAAIGGGVAFQMRASAGTVQAAAVALPAPPPPPQPVSHAYDPGPPVKLGDGKPPLTLTVRDDPKADEKPIDDKKADDKKVDPKKTMASGKRPKPAAHARHSAPAQTKFAGSGFKLGKSGSKYDPLNGSL
jgi:hypothetical protein